MRLSAPVAGFNVPVALWNPVPSTSLERTPDGRRWVVSERFARPPAAAWDRLVDTDAWPEWGPSVAAVECDERWVRAGSTGRVEVDGVGAWVPFQVTSLDWDGERGRWTWQVARIPATGHAVDPVDGGCRVAFEVPLAAVAYVPVCRRGLAGF
jgi:hypothetical protein